MKSKTAESATAAALISPVALRAKRLVEALYLVEAWIAGLGLGLVAIALFADVVGREAVGSGIFGAQRSAVYGMIVSAFLGLTLATHKGRHIRIEGFDRLVPEAARPLVVRLGHFVSLVICLFLGYWSAEFVLVSFEQGERGMALDVLVWPFKIVLPWAFASAGIRYLVFALFPAVESGPEEAT